MNNNQENREKWLKKSLKEIRKNSKILDAGAGELQYKKYCGHLKYTSQDFGQYTGNNIQEGLQTGKWNNSLIDIVSDIVNIPVKKSSFDAIMCVEVLEHLPQPALAIKEFSRILKKDGTLLITAPFASITHFAPYYFANGYSKYWYEKILVEAGFSIVEISYNGNYFLYLAQELKRLLSVASAYSRISRMQRLVYELLSIPIIKILDNLSSNNHKSEELLCFGLHVIAKKDK